MESPKILGGGSKVSIDYWTTKRAEEELEYCSRASYKIREEVCEGTVRAQ